MGSADASSSIIGRQRKMMSAAMESEIGELWWCISHFQCGDRIIALTKCWKPPRLQEEHRIHFLIQRFLRGR